MIPVLRMSRGQASLIGFPLMPNTDPSIRRGMVHSTSSAAGESELICASDSTIITDRIANFNGVGFAVAEDKMQLPGQSPPVDRDPTPRERRADGAP